jgi:hypothetical protein
VPGGNLQRQLGEWESLHLAWTQPGRKIAGDRHLARPRLEVRQLVAWAACLDIIWVNDAKVELSRAFVPSEIDGSCLRFLNQSLSPAGLV